MLVKGSKIKLVKEMGAFKNVGEVCEVIDVSDDDVITFKFGNGLHMGCMSYDEFYKYFEKYEEPKIAPRITQEQIEEIIEDSCIESTTVFDKCTIVSCKLPNGFVIVESSACVSPDNYDEEVGFDICMDRIADKIWELEGYKLQSDLYEGFVYDFIEDEQNENEDEVDDDCENCEYYHVCQHVNI